MNDRTSLPPMVEQLLEAETRFHVEIVGRNSIYEFKTLEEAEWYCREVGDCGPIRRVETRVYGVRP